MSCWHYSLAYQSFTNILLAIAVLFSIQRDSKALSVLRDCYQRQQNKTCAHHKSQIGTTRLIKHELQLLVGWKVQSQLSSFSVIYIDTVGVVLCSFFLIVAVAEVMVARLGSGAQNSHPKNLKPSPPSLQCRSLDACNSNILDHISRHWLIYFRSDHMHSLPSMCTLSCSHYTCTMWQLNEKGISMSLYNNKL